MLSAYQYLNDFPELPYLPYAFTTILKLEEKILMKNFKNILCPLLSFEKKLVVFETCCNFQRKVVSQMKYNNEGLRKHD